MVGRGSGAPSTRPVFPDALRGPAPAGCGGAKPMRLLATASKTACPASRGCKPLCRTRAADLVADLYGGCPRHRITDILKWTKPPRLHRGTSRTCEPGSPAAETGSVCLTCLLAVGTNLGLRETAEATTTHRSGSWCASPPARGERRVRPSTARRRAPARLPMPLCGALCTNDRRNRTPLGLPHTTPYYAFDLGKSGRHGVRPFPDPCNIGSELLGQFRPKVTSKPWSPYPSGFRR